MLILKTRILYSVASPFLRYSTLKMQKIIHYSTYHQDKVALLRSFPCRQLMRLKPWILDLVPAQSRWRVAGQLAQEIIFPWSSPAFPELSAHDMSSVLISGLVWVCWASCSNSFSRCHRLLEPIVIELTCFVLVNYCMLWYVPMTEGLFNHGTVFLSR